MKTISVFLLFIYLCSFSFNSNAAVWETHYEWDHNWEIHYSDWVKDKWTRYIFTSESSPYKGIATDCADASYAMRAIFAFENNLTFAVYDPTNRRSKGIISNKMKRYDNVPAGIPRLKTFIDFLSAVLSTSTLADDTVPIDLSPRALIPGIIYVKPRVHSYQIKDWSEQGIPVTMNSTTPYSVKDMHKYLSFPAYIPKDTKTFHDGYRRFKQPKELHQPTTTLHDYSTHQYKVSEHYDFNNVLFNEYIIDSIGTRKETDEEKTKRLMFNICYSSYNRASAITESTDYYNKIRSQGRSCMNAQEFDQFSTFSRDKRLKEYFVILKKYLDKTNNLRGHNFRYKYYAVDLFNENPESYDITNEQFLNFCNIPYKPGGEISVRDVWYRLKYNLLVQNPNTTSDWRWGDYQTTFQTSCPTFEEIH